MPDILEIEGNIVRHIQRTIIAETSVAELAPLIERRAPSIYPILPNNTVVAAFDPEHKRGVVVVERPPERVNLNVHFDIGLTGNTPDADWNRARTPTGGVNRARFNIQLPYLYFIYGFKLEVRTRADHVGLADFALDRSLLFWRPDPLRKMTDRLWKASLPNVQDALICWGNPEWDTTDTLAMRVNQMVNEFPITTFTNHYGLPRPEEYESYIDWEAASENPLCFRDWNQFKHNTGSKETGPHILKLMENGGGADYGEMPLPEDWANVIIPPPPTQFTMGRLRDWIETIPAPMRQRFLAEAARIGAGNTADGA